MKKWLLFKDGTHRILDRYFKKGLYLIHVKDRSNRRKNRKYLLLYAVRYGDFYHTHT